MAQKMERCLDLSIGQPDFDVPTKLKNIANKSIQDGLNTYTPSGGIESARRAVKNKYGIDDSKDLDVIITAGVSGGLLLSFAALLDQGDDILIPDPYFVGYKEIPIMLGARPVLFDTYPDFIPSIEKIDAAITSKTKAVVIGSPSNPTGVTLSQNQIDRLVQYAKEKNIYLIFDEIYEMFTYDRPHARPQLEDHVIILNGLSKSHAMTGWRIGWAVAHAPLVDQMQKLQQFSFVCAPAPFQHVIPEALAHFDQSILASYRKKRDKISSALSQKYELETPGGAFYLFPKSTLDSGERFVKNCIQNSLLVIPGSVFSAKDSHFRISFAVRDEILDEAIDILMKL